MKVLIGQFRHDSSLPNPEFHVSNSNNIIYDIDCSHEPDVPLNTKLEILVKDNILESWRTDPLLPLESRNTSKKNIALIRVKTENESFSDKDKETLKKWGKALQDEYRWLAQGKWVVNVDTYLYNTGGAFGLREFNWQELKTFLRKNYPEKNYNYLHCIGGFGDVCGRAWLGGNEAWTYSDCSEQTIIHEQGHNFGVSHAGKGNQVYGESDVWMGSGLSRSGMNAPHIYTLGLIENRNIDQFELQDSRISYLVEGETIDLAVPAGANRIAILRNSVSPKITTVSLHKGKIDIHIPFNSASTTMEQTKIVSTLNIGEEYNEEGVSIKYISKKEHVAKVAIQNRTKIKPKDSAEFPSYWIPENAASFYDKNGIWGNSLWSAQGVHVRYLKDRSQVYVAWLSWDKDKNKEWHYGFLDVENNVARGELKSGKDAYISGKAQLYFYDNMNGLFRAQTEEHGKFAMPIGRISMGKDHPLNGYYNLDEGRDSISIEVTNRDTIIAYLLTYKYVLGQIKTDWRMISGEVGGELIVYDIRGGRLGVDTDEEIIKENIARIEGNKLHYDGKTFNLKRIA